MSDWYREHILDPPDHADAYALLDDVIVRWEGCKACMNFVCQCDGGEAPEKFRRYMPAMKEGIIHDI